LPLDVYKEKKLNEMLHQSYSLSSSTHLDLDKSHYAGPNQPPSKSNFSKALKHQLAQQILHEQFYSYVWMCTHIHTHTHTYRLYRRWR